MSETWFNPVDVVADGLFEHGEACRAILTNGDEVGLFYGHLTSDDEDCWTGFYNEDGEEVFNDTIKQVRPLGASAILPQHHQPEPVSDPYKLETTSAVKDSLTTADTTQEKT